MPPVTARAPYLLALAPLLLAPLLAARTAAAETGRELEVVFRAVEGPATSIGDLPPAVGVEVELGLAPLAEASASFAGCEVLARARSDADGRVQAVLRLPDGLNAEAEEELRVWARVDEPGRQRRVATLRTTRLREQPRLSVVRGATLAGVLVDAGGDPVAGAELLLVDSEVGSRRHGGATSGPGGRFALHARGEQAARPLRVLAWKSNAGVLLSAPLLVERERGRPLRLALGAGLPLAGRVVDPAGAPVPFLTLTAVPASGYPGAERPYDGELTGGLLVDRTRTDREGAFELASLAPGEYALHGRFVTEHRSCPLAPPPGGLLGEELGRVQVPSRGPVVVRSAQTWLEVAVVDERGEPLALDTREPLPLEVRVVGGGGWSLAPCPADPARLHGPLVFPLAGDLAERPLLVSWTEPGRPYLELHVTPVPSLPFARPAGEQHAGARTRVLLALGPPCTPAELNVRVLGPDGEELRSPGVRVLADSGRELARAWPGSPGWSLQDVPYPRTGAGWTASLPPGRFRVVASEPFVGCVVPAEYPRELLVPVDQLVELGAGQRRELVLRLGAAGHLDLEPRAPRPPLSRGDVQAVRDEVARRGPVEVTLFGADGSRCALERFQLAGVIDQGLGPVPGQPARGLSPAPVGDWTLVLERGDTVLLEGPLTIEEGEVTTVVW